MYSLVIGRFQPLHDGHKALIRKLLDEDRSVCIALMNTEQDEKNPYSVSERRQMLEEEFGNRVVITTIPPISEACYGRNVGYKIRRVHHNGEAISGTAIREGKEVEEPITDPEFLDSYRRIAELVHGISDGQGFWPDADKTDISYKIAHLHSEISEAWEAARTGGADKNIEDMSGVEVQLADALGILMDMEVSMGLKISEALLRKIQFNKTRDFLHGKKF